MRPNATTLDKIPWRRIVHFYGRADNVERAIRRLEVADFSGRMAAVQELRRCLEHQDGVIQATPIAVPFIVSVLAKPNDPVVKVNVLELLAACLASARFQIEDKHATIPQPKFDDLMTPDKLWPEYVSDEEDEALWEEAGIVDDVEIWALVTIDQIVSAREVFEHLARTDTSSSVMTAATHLIAQIDRPQTNKLDSNPKVLRATKRWWRFW